MDQTEEKHLEAIISTTDLRKQFHSRRGPVEAVRGVSIEVGQGEIFGFLGPNGAGKTTTLRMLTTLLPIDSGRATVAGIDVARKPKQVRQRIGYVSQLGGADELATGRENLILQGRLYGGDRVSVTSRAKLLMEILDLNEFADRRVKTYSGGSADDSTSRSGSCTSPKCCSSMSRAPGSIRRTGRISGSTSARCARAARRSSSRRTTSRRPTCSAIAS